MAPKSTAFFRRKQFAYEMRWLPSRCSSLARIHSRNGSQALTGPGWTRGSGLAGTSRPPRDAWGSSRDECRADWRVRPVAGFAERLQSGLQHQIVHPQSKLGVGDKHKERSFVPIYLDHCSTTPIDPRVLDAMLPFLRESFGNPGTPHPAVGGVVQRAVRDAREAAALLINCRPNELIWTSGATEAINLAILGLAENTPKERKHIVTQVTEHSAVLEPCRYLEAKGWQVTYLPVDQHGMIDLQMVENAITDSTSLVSIMWGNNEIGTIQPVEEIAGICSDRCVPFHCDATQAVGKVEIDLEAIAVSMLTFSAHKLYGPKGVGALFIRDLNRKQLIAPRQFGGGQEKSLRAGTLNVPCVVGMGAACSLANDNFRRWSECTAKLRDRFESILFDRLADISINGQPANRLPHITNIAFHGTDNEGLLTMLPELVASTGSACHVADFAPSHVLASLMKARDVSECSLRFGFGKENNEEEVTIAASAVCKAVERFRADGAS